MPMVFSKNKNVSIFPFFTVKLPWPFQICHCAELNKIVEATMPVNSYDDRKVSLRRPHGNGDFDIVGASYTGR